MINDPRYEPINTALPQMLPPLTRKDAHRYARLLIDHFGDRENACALRTRRMTYAVLDRWHGGARKVWVSPRPTTGHHRGWGRLIHDLSHMVFRYRHLGFFRPHEHGHERLELEMAQYVVTQGWLSSHMDSSPPGCAASQGPEADR